MIVLVLMQNEITIKVLLIYLIGQLIVDIVVNWGMVNELLIEYEFFVINVISLNWY